MVYIKKSKIPILGMILEKEQKVDRILGIIPIMGMILLMQCFYEIKTRIIPIMGMFLKSVLIGKQIF